ncbi:MAG: GNAT family N-acetyltransferase [Phycisphaerae bacterium]|nr:GNAT family N-acetyltransferase [Phycisphaerae bacterium]MDW8262911.1 GNAT family N-acetyltransferase [Phycisphaerales bacterium]
MKLPLPVPGEIHLLPARFNDYKTLARFHYRPGHPSTIADLVAAWHFPADRADPRAARSPNQPPRCVGVAVLSWPTACSLGRQRAIPMQGWSYGQRLRFANANIRCISRVIVHPTYRCLGLGSQLIRLLIQRCPTRYIEASAQMAHVHPLFERAGMVRHDLGPDRPVYFLFDKASEAGRIRSPAHRPHPQDSPRDPDRLTLDHDSTPASADSRPTVPPGITAHSVEPAPASSAGAPDRTRVRSGCLYQNPSTGDLR